MITIDFSSRPIVFCGNVGDKFNIPSEEDMVIVGTDTVFALLKVYYFDKGVEFRHATEDEVKKYKIKKLSELTGIDVGIIE